MASGRGGFLRGEFNSSMSDIGGVSSGVTSVSGGRGDAGVFSVVLNNRHHHHHHAHHAHRWRFFSVSTRSFWTKYCLLCTICGSAATILAAIFLVVAALFRYYTTSVYYFETVPTYIPAILLSICGVSTIAFSCKRNRNIILLRITACWSLVSAALSSVITITTSLIHMNRLQTLRECVHNSHGKTNQPPSCTCIAHSLSYDSIGPDFEPVHYVFENTPDCDVIHGTLYSCLRAVFAGSVVAVLLSIFLCMLLYQLIGHERKKAYWSRIRRINSDWSSDFIACLGRPMPRERSSMLPLIMSPSGSMPMSMGGQPILPPGLLGWGPPPPYQATDELQLQAGGSSTVPNFVAVPPPPSATISSSNNNKNHVTFAGIPIHHSHSTHQAHPHHHQEENPLPINCAHPFSPTITSVDPITTHNNNNNNNNYSQSLSILNTDSSNDSTLSQTNQERERQSSHQRLFSAILSNANIRQDEEGNHHDKELFMNSDENMCWSETRDLRPRPYHSHRHRHHHHHHQQHQSHNWGKDGEVPVSSPLLVSTGIKSSGNSGRITRMGRISSLPNSPILMNVRRFCNFRLSEREKKKSNSTNKLDSAAPNNNVLLSSQTILDKTNICRIDNNIDKSSQSIDDNLLEGLDEGGGTDEISYHLNVNQSLGDEEKQLPSSISSLEINHQE